MTYDIRDTIAEVAERRIRAALDAGELEDLAGAGKPLTGAGRPDDEMWWIRAWVKRQQRAANDRPES